MSVLNNTFPRLAWKIINFVDKFDEKKILKCLDNRSEIQNLEIVKWYYGEWDKEERKIEMVIFPSYNEVNGMWNLLICLGKESDKLYKP